MKWQHLMAFVWLRWRLGINQVRKSGVFGMVVLAILIVLGVTISFCSFFATFAIGYLALTDVRPPILLFIWDGVVALFLLVWLTSLLADLQRSDALTLTKFLYLPVSPTGAFLVNYLSSLLSLRLILFVPAMMGLILGMALSRSLLVLLGLPLLFAFFLMVTALTNQFQGWLASLMANKRRRRTVVVMLTFGLFLTIQLPNIVFQIWRPQLGKQDVDRQVAMAERQAKRQRIEVEEIELQTKLQAKQITPASMKERTDELAEQLQELQESDTQEAERAYESDAAAKERGMWVAYALNIVIPAGALPLGISTLVEGSILPAVLGFLGMTLIGSLSLARSYQTTLRIYTGQIGSARRKIPRKEQLPRAEKQGDLFLEKKLPWLGEAASAVALCTLRSQSRAPEAKMLLLTAPLILVIFGAITLTQSNGIAGYLLPFLPQAAMAMISFTSMQIVGNQFAYDRAGFRSFVLCGVPRRAILLGKNLAIAPFALGLGFIAAIVLQCFLPLSIDHFVATAPQFISMYLLFCLVGNLLSILAPMPVAPGSMRPVKPNLSYVLLQMLFPFVFMAILATTFIPLGLEQLLRSLEYSNSIPIALILTLVEFVLVLFIYYFALGAEGQLLQWREQKILDIIAPKAE
jgi:hypothetical protein